MKIAHIIIIAGLGVAVVALYYMLKRRDHFVSAAASCTQICSFAHPMAIQECEDKPNGNPDCESYHQCINECRADQQESIAAGGNNADLWDGPYGKLL
jgi:hypothetical protein